MSHSSTESEIVALDMGLRLDGLPAVTLWDTIIQVLEPIPNEDVDSDKNRCEVFKSESQLTRRNC